MRFQIKVLWAEQCVTCGIVASRRGRSGGDCGKETPPRPHRGRQNGAAGTSQVRGYHAGTDPHQREQGVQGEDLCTILLSLLEESEYQDLGQ